MKQIDACALSRSAAERYKERGFEWHATPDERLHPEAYTKFTREVETIDQMRAWRSIHQLLESKRYQACLEWARSSLERLQNTSWALDWKNLRDVFLSFAEPDPLTVSRDAHGFFIQNVLMHMAVTEVLFQLGDQHQLNVWYVSSNFTLNIQGWDKQLDPGSVPPVVPSGGFSGAGPRPESKVLADALEYCGRNNYPAQKLLVEMCLPELRWKIAVQTGSSVVVNVLRIPVLFHDEAYTEPGESALNSQIWGLLPEYAVDIRQWKELRALGRLRVPQTVRKRFQDAYDSVTKWSWEDFTGLLPPVNAKGFRYPLHVSDAATTIVGLLRAGRSPSDCSLQQAKKCVSPCPADDQCPKASTAVNARSIAVYEVNGPFPADKDVWTLAAVFAALGRDVVTRYREWLRDQAAKQGKIYGRNLDNVGPEGLQSLIAYHPYVDEKKGTVGEWMLDVRLRQLISAVQDEKPQFATKIMKPWGASDKLLEDLGRAAAILYIADHMLQEGATYQERLQPLFQSCRISFELRSKLSLLPQFSEDMLTSSLSLVEESSEHLPSSFLKQNLVPNEEASWTILPPQLDS